MTIGERLRAREKLDTTSANRLMDEAAAKLDKYEEALRRIAGQTQFKQNARAISIAREALGGGE